MQIINDWRVLVTWLERVKSENLTECQQSSVSVWNKGIWGSIWGESWRNWKHDHFHKLPIEEHRASKVHKKAFGSKLYA